MRLRAERVIPRPAEEVAEFFLDAGNNPYWQSGMARCEWTTPPPLGVGSRYDQEASFMGRKVLSTFRVTDHQPGRLIEIETITGPFPIRVTRTVEPIAEHSSRVTAEILGEPGGLMGLLAPLTRRLAQRSVDADYDRLVDLMSRS